MSFTFTDEIFREIEKVLDVKFARRESQFRAVLVNSEQGRRLSIEIYPEMKLGKKSGNLLSIYTRKSHIQLHNCTGFVSSEVLGEVTFFSELEGFISGIVVEKGAAFSAFSNVDSSLLSGDFTQLAPEVMLSGIALSLAEPLLENKKD
jgi:hypothetical protein